MRVLTFLSSARLNNANIPSRSINRIAKVIVGAIVFKSSQPKPLKFPLFSLPFYALFFFLFSLARRMATYLRETLLSATPAIRRHVRSHIIIRLGLAAGCFLPIGCFEPLVRIRPSRAQAFRQSRARVALVHIAADWPLCHTRHHAFAPIRLTADVIATVLRHLVSRIVNLTTDVIPTLIVCVPIAAARHRTVVPVDLTTDVIPTLIVGLPIAAARHRTVVPVDLTTDVIPTLVVCVPIAAARHRTVVRRIVSRTVDLTTDVIPALIVCLPIAAARHRTVPRRLVSRTVDLTTDVITVFCLVGGHVRIMRRVPANRSTWPQRCTPVPHPAPIRNFLNKDAFALGTTTRVIDAVARMHISAFQTSCDQ
jgi:hypothetical protein